MVANSKRAVCGCSGWPRAPCRTGTRGGVRWPGFVALVFLVASRTWRVVVAFGVFAAYAPVALVRFRARQRRHELRELWPDAVDNLASAVRSGCRYRKRSPNSACADRNRCGTHSSASARTIARAHGYPSAWAGHGTALGFQESADVLGAEPRQLVAVILCLAVPRPNARARACRGLGRGDLAAAGVTSTA
jgi:hypothetical protein